MGKGNKSQMHRILSAMEVGSERISKNSFVLVFAGNEDEKRWSVRKGLLLF